MYLSAYYQYNENKMEQINKSDGFLIFIVGSTASGKTKLSLELAKANEKIEIINADALQLYKDANIMVAKATEEEQSKVKHHMLDILSLDATNFTRKEYCDKAVAVIQDIWSRNKIPLVVGGTNYYIESLLFNDYDIQDSLDLNQIDEMHEKVNKTLGENSTGESEISLEDPIFNDWMMLPVDQKFGLLKRIDPLIAEKVHQNDQKRIENYIKLYIDEKIIPSKKIMAVNNQRKLRYSNPVIFWVKDQSKENLHKRMKKRIDEMLDINGIKEIIRIYSTLDKNQEFDFTKGVLQSIGYKEFHEFYNLLKQTKGSIGSSAQEYMSSLKAKDELSSEENVLLEKCSNNLVLATQHYARRQLQWIKNRLSENQHLKQRVFQLEFEDASKFNEQVIDKALKVLEDYFANKLALDLKNDETSEDFYLKWKRIYCEDCEIYANGEKEYKIHIATKKHKKRKEKKNIYMKNMEIKMQKELEKQKELENSEPK